MTLSRDIRRSALQALYQFDCGATTEDEEMVLDSLDGGAGDRESQKVGYDLARRVWEKHAEADEMLASLTVEWPTHRQPVVDRNLLRLGWYEISSGETPPKVAINEAVELAREFSTEKSPLFVNGVLDKVYRLLREESPTTEMEG